MADILKAMEAILAMVVWIAIASCDNAMPSFLFTSSW